MLATLLLLGCTSSNNLSSGSDASTDLSSLQSIDLTVVPDLGGPGATCTTACDCMPGLSCGMGMTCQQLMQGNVYCCESSNCPDGSFCQSGVDSSFMMCGGGRDGGMFMRGDGGMRGRDGGGGRNRDM